MLVLGRGCTYRRSFTCSHAAHRLLCGLIPNKPQIYWSTDQGLRIPAKRTTGYFLISITISVWSPMVVNIFWISVVAVVLGVRHLETSFQCKRIDQEPEAHAEEINWPLQVVSHKAVAGQSNAQCIVCGSRPGVDWTIHSNIFILIGVRLIVLD